MIQKWQLWLFPLTFNFHSHSLRLWQVSTKNKLHKYLHWCSYIHIFFNAILYKVNKQVDINHLVPDSWLGEHRNTKCINLSLPSKSSDKQWEIHLAQNQRYTSWVNSPRKIYCKEVISDLGMTEWVNIILELKNRTFHLCDTTFCPQETPVTL